MAIFWTFLSHVCFLRFYNIKITYFHFIRCIHILVGGVYNMYSIFYTRFSYICLRVSQERHDMTLFMTQLFCLFNSTTK